MATSWAKCPDLFLYTKMKDVYLWRCNETTRMPMKTADFDDLGKVTDYLDLIGGKDSIVDWEESSYNDLVAYISSRRLLVNCRGLVIAELHEFDQEGKMEENGLPFYMRSLDVLSLKPFGLRNRTIPSRMVLYLETEGEAAAAAAAAASVEDDSDSDSNNTTTTNNMEKRVAELKAENKTLKRDKETAERKAADLQTQIDSLAAINIVEKKEEVWMNEFSDETGNWKTFDGLNKEIYRIVTVYPAAGSAYRTTHLTDDDLTTNVLSSYIYMAHPIDALNQVVYVPAGSPSRPYFGLKAVKLADLKPNMERARFNFLQWYRGCTNDGDMYAIKEIQYDRDSKPPGDAAKFSAEEVKSLKLLGNFF